MYYVFQSARDRVNHLWAIRERGSFWPKASHEPLQLTSGPMQFRVPVPSKDGKRIFAIGDQVRGEIMRYVKGSEVWAPYHPEKSMVWLDFSRDGQWVAYVAYPEGTLWRSKADFGASQQLTFLPMEVTAPRWSPDGSQIAFQGRPPGKPWKIYTVSSSGGNPRQLLPGNLNEALPDWSPDGNRMAFGGFPTLPTPKSTNTWLRAIHLLDLTTNQVSVLADSKGFYCPRWSPDGKHLVAHSHDLQKLMLFESATSKWEALAEGRVHFANWSRDGQYVYFERWDEEDMSAVRVRIKDRKLERIGNLRQFRRTIGAERCWSGLGPDDSLLVLRDTGGQEIYGLDWEAP
jgi:Tol biopolymer transport system component